MTRLTLVFSYGVSLKVWDDSGFLSREISYYKDLVDNGVEVQFLTYGDNSEFEFSDILGDLKIIPIYGKMKSRNLR